MTRPVTPKRLHFRTVQRKCQTCKSKYQTYSTGEYINSKWHNVQDVCMACQSQLIATVAKFERANGRLVEFVGDVPLFLMPPVDPAQASSAPQEEGK